MNKGAFYKEGKNLFILDFGNNILDVPFELIRNGMVSKNREGCYVVTNVKDRTVDINFLLIVQDEKKIENPFELNSLTKNLSDTNILNFTPIQSANCAEPFLDEIEERLLEIGFFRTDKINFKRELFNRRKEQFGKL